MLRYIGGGFLRGIPARDLTDEEVKRFGKDRLLKSGLYSETEKTKPPKKKAVKEQ